MLEYVVSGAVGVIFSESYRWLARWLRTSDQRHFWEFTKRNTTILMADTKRSKYGIDAGYGDWTAIVKIHQTLTRLFSDISLPILSAASCYEENKHDNLLVIGGPMFNQAAQELLLATNCPFHFDYEQMSIKSADNAQVYRAMQEAEEIVRDIGLIVIAKNPLARDMIVMILAGCYSFGTAAAATYLLEKGYTELRGRRENIALVVATEVVRRVPRRPKPVSPIVDF